MSATHPRRACASTAPPSALLLVLTVVLGVAYPLA